MRSGGRLWVGVVATVLALSVGMTLDRPLAGDPVTALDEEPRILVVAGSTAPPANDRDIIEILDDLGSVEIVDDDDIDSVGSASGIDLVIITTSVDSQRPYGNLADVDVPIVTWEPFVADDLRMADAAGETRMAGAVQHIEVVGASDPLAVGQSGRTYVTTTASTFSFATPAPSARVIAHVSGQPAQAVLFAYGRGDRLTDGSAAPSCRIMTFPTWDSAALLTPVGTAMLRAAFVEALGCATPAVAVDEDGDGFSPPEDCDDADPRTYPGATEIADDGRDQNCDGRDLVTPSGEPIRNVVLILTDDMNYADYAYMPKTQALLSGEGVTFDNAHQNTPLCCPARATLLTGQRSKHHGVTTNKPAQGQGYIALDHTNTLATWFESTGYNTIYVGKYMNGYGYDGLDPEVPDDLEITPGWTDFQPLVGNLTYHRYTINDNGVHVTYEGEDNYQTDVLADRAVTSIGESVGAGLPFYLMISPHAPHTYNGNPPLPAPRHASLYDDVPAPRSPSFNEANVSDKPGYVKSAPRITASAARKHDEHWRRRIESLQSVDDLVERVYDALVAHDSLDETLIVFMSDNGYMLGEHRLQGKVRPYEESTHVPLVMRGGPFLGGARVDHVVSSTDVTPTIVAVTGISAGLTMDGLDLSAVLTDPARYEDRAIIIEMVEGPGYEAVRTERWLWVEYHGSGRELYDMVNDPFQLTSRHKSPGPHAQVRAELATVLGQLRGCAGPECIVRANP